MENNLDKFFRDNLHDRKFEPKAEDWLGAEKLIDAQDYRRKRRSIFWWFFNNVMVLSLFAGLFIWNNVRSNKQAVKNETEIAVEKHNNEGKALLNNKDSMSSEDGPSNPIDSLNNIDKTTKTQAPIYKNEAAKKENKTASLNTRQSKNRSQQTTDNKQLANQKAGSSNFSNNDDLNDLNRAESIKSGVNKTAINPPSIETQTTTESQQNDAASMIATPNESDLIRSTAPDFLTIIQILVKGNFVKQNLSTTTQKIEVLKPAKWQISLFAAQFGQPVTDNGEKAFLGQRAGLSLRKNLRGGWYLATGVSYQRRVGSFDATRAAYQRNYRFGLELDTLLLRPMNLHYVSVPVLFGFERNRHRFEAGLLLDYLTGVRGETGSYQKQGEPPVKVFQVEKTGWVTTDGYRRFVPTAQLGYNYQLARRWSVGLTANYSIGGILEKGFEAPVGSFLLKEAEKFHLGAQVVYRIN